MIVVKIGDGMGNQLFNYACGYAAARRENEKLLLVFQSVTILLFGILNWINFI